MTVPEPDLTTQPIDQLVTEVADIFNCRCCDGSGTQNSFSWLIRCEYCAGLGKALAAVHVEARDVMPIVRELARRARLNK